MTERVRFHFDPLCPWCYQTSRWVRELVALGEVDVDWAVFSLEICNQGSEESLRKGHVRARPILQTVMVVRDEAGSEGVGRFYAAAGAAIHERGEAPDDPTVVRSALSEAGLNSALFDTAMSDEGNWLRVEQEHRALVDRTRSFGVPTIVLDGGDGPAIFGPVISRVPAGDEAVELFRHVAWLTRYENFSELKRDRVDPPDLESVRRRERANVPA
jgi:protein-disulfide isomerase-like protein with CxxC motif